MEVSDADREAAADIWRDYVARPGEIIVERALREGRMDDSSIIEGFARHRHQSLSTQAAEQRGMEKAADEVERLRAENASLRAEIERLISQTVAVPRLDR